MKSSTGLSVHRPTASIATLKARAILLREIRRFFDDAGFFEVETPLLSADIVVDAWLEPFVAEWFSEPASWQQPGVPRFLQTSPEFAMKRLVAAGAERIYQLGKVFRNAEIGPRHNPEFTMLEWYRRGDDLKSLMDFTERLVRAVFTAADGLAEPLQQSTAQVLGRRALCAEPFERLTYRQAFRRVTEIEVLTCAPRDLARIASEYRLTPPPSMSLEDRDDWLNLLLAELIEPSLGRERPTFLTNYPASQAALARLSPDGQTSERFELYLDGIELCNGYDELTDTTALRDRVRQQAALRSRAGLRPLPETSRLLAAMEDGLPPCAGNALGVDRLVMLALGYDEIARVISFPFEIA